MGVGPACSVWGGVGVTLDPVGLVPQPVPRREKAKQRMRGWACQSSPSTLCKCVNVYSASL